MPFPVETFEQLQSLFWVMIRISIVMFLLPIFGAKGLPSLWKIGTAFIIALVILPVVPPPANFPATTSEILFAVIKELFLGITMAIGVKMFFTSVQMAGQFMAFQMGFSMARAMDPQTGAQSTVLSQFLYLFVSLLFFTMDLHHQFIRAIAFSFQVLPPDSISLNMKVMDIVITVSSQMFLLALKIAAPIMITLFLSNLCLGIIARTVPQVNILMVGFPINITIGLITFGLILSNFNPFIIDLGKKMSRYLAGIIGLM